MTQYYIRTTGSDSNNGLSAGAAWLTFDKALGASGIASGDNVLVGGGTYRQSATCTVSMTSAVAETVIRGDVQNTLGDGSEVRWSAYSTNDTTTPGTFSLITLNDRDYLTFQDMTLIGGNANSTVFASSAGSNHITVKRCTLISGRTTSGGIMINLNTTAGVAAVWVIDACRFLNSSVEGNIDINLVRPSGADFDYDIQITNNVNICPQGPFVYITASGANTFNGGGVDVIGNTHIGTSGLIQTASANLSTSIPAATAYKNVIVGGSGAPFNANASGQIVEDYNRVFTATSRTNTSTGANSIDGVTHALLLDIGQSYLFEGVAKVFGTPLSSSPLLGRGGSGTALTTDNLNRPRPAGGASASLAWGALERHDTAISPGTTVGADAGSGYIELVGVGDHDFDVPVDATATTFTVKTKTSGYSGTNYPQMKILNGGQCGVSDASVDATSASASAYESISIGPFTPTSKGIVTVRLTNRSANGTGIAAFDTFAVS